MRRALEPDPARAAFPPARERPDSDGDLPWKCPPRKLGGGPAGLSWGRGRIGPGGTMTKPHAQPVPTEAPAAGPALAASPVWEPLRQPLFRALWLAALASNVGTWMQDVGATWLMTSLTTSPILIALIQAATTLPVFLLALVAGALADVVDRRRLLIVTQSWMLLASAALGALTVLGLAKAWVLLLFTFLVGTGNALNAPAWQAIIPELVGRRDLPSALALIPVLLRFQLGCGPTAYGLVLGCFGLGAVAGALLLPRLRQALSFDRLAQAASLLFGLILGGLAFAESYALVCLLMTLGGAAWIALLTTFHTSAQASLAPWVRGRGLAVYLLVFFGGMAGGSALWGAVATHLGLRAALVLAGAMTILGVPATVRFRLRRGEAPDLAPSRHWPARVVVGEPDADHGPVLITVEYRVDPDRAEDFSRAMRDVRRIRLRDGAFRWDLLSDPADPGRYVESFLVESWIEHLRQHERVTVADREVEDRARLYHLGPGPPVVSHFVSRDLPR